MRPPAALVIKAAAKRLRAPEGPSEEQQAPAPRRRSARTQPSAEQRQVALIPEVDLTSDASPTRTEVNESAQAGTVLVRPVTGESTVPDESLPVEMDRSWGEGPSGAGPLPEQAVAASPSRSGPGPAEDVQRSEAEATPRVPSRINEGRRAEQLLAHVIQPDIQERLRGTGVNKFYRGISSALVEVVNSMALTREALEEGESLMRQMQQDNEARIEALERSLESVKADLGNKVKEAKNKAGTTAQRLDAALNQLAASEDAIEARNLHIEELKSAMQEAKNRAMQAEEERAATASLMLEKEARIAEMEATAEARAAAAVEEFKSSEQFSNELVEANADYYARGFDDARRKIARVMDLPQAASITPDLEPPENPEGERAADS